MSDVNPQSLPGSLSLPEGFEVPGYLGPAAHTWTSGCDGAHPVSEPCPATRHDAAPELAAAMAETRIVRDGYRELVGEFGPSPQAGWSARISLTVLNRHRELAGLDKLSPTPSNNGEDTLLRYRRERDEARAELAELDEAYRLAHAENERLHGQVTAASNILHDRDEAIENLRQQLARALAANQRRAEALGDVQQAGRERDGLRALVAEILAEFKPGSPPVTSWHAEASVPDDRRAQWRQRAGLGEP